MVSKTRPTSAEEPLDYVARYAQNVFGRNPVVVFGSGASYPHGLPNMHDLQTYLIQNIALENEEEKEAWHVVRRAIESGQHLEQAMSGKILPASLIDKLVLSTWHCVNEKDRDVYSRALTLHEHFPAALLFRDLFKSTASVINVVTTNYDRLVEYACDSANLVHMAGFTPGYLGNREGSDTVRVMRGARQARTVRIWKVHGSLDWFERPDGTIISAPIFELPPDGLKPVVVTPGITKYERTHEEPFRSVIQGADRALEHAEAFLCVGFGFRDPHLEPRLVERCRQKNVPITVLARTLTEEAKTFLRTKAGRSYLALEKCGRGTKAYTIDYPDGIELPEEDYWSLQGYLRLVT